VFGALFQIAVSKSLLKTWTEGAVGFSTEHVTIRDARRSDSAELAQLINFAGEGLPLYLWRQSAAAGEDPWKIGRERAAREAGGFSYRNAIIAEVDGKVTGALIGYPVAAEPEPVDTDGTPPMFVPLLELENLAAATWYVNAVAAFPEARGLGVGSMLMQWAEQRASKLGLQGVSLIVSDANPGARKLYDRRGYKETARRPMIKEQWRNGGKDWVLMIKSIELA
jgi:ribosomal protein S18 acetylase RimI-like enzyme